MISNLGGSPRVGTSPANRWHIHAVLLITVSMTLTGINIVNVALPTIQDGLNATEAELQWILAGYALSFGVVLIPAGRLGDLIGRPIIYVVGIAIFCVASVSAGLADDINVLIVARIVQGLGSGILSPQILGLIQQNFSGAERSRAFGAYGSVVALSMGGAPVLGGVIIALAGPDDGWRWTFFVNVPVSILAIVLVFLWFPKPLRLPPPERSTRRDLDLGGAALLGVAILLILMPFVTPNNGITWILLPLGFAAGSMWVAWERRYRANGRLPMVDFAILTRPTFRSGVIIATSYFFGATSIWVVVALYLQFSLGFTALEAGLVGLPSAAMGVLTSQWAGRMLPRFGRRIVTAGIVLAICGLLASIGVILAHATGHLSIWWLLLTLAPIGGAQGAVISPNQTLTLAAVPLGYAGSSGGVIQTGQRIGAALGIAATTATLFAVQASATWTTAITTAFGVIIAILIVTLAASIVDQVRQIATGEKQL